MSLPVVSVPNTIASQTTNIPGAFFDQNWAALVNYINSNLSSTICVYQSRGANCSNNVGTPNTQFDMDADSIVLSDPGFTRQPIVVSNPSSVTNNISTAGPAVNGRDQAGAFGNDSWIHFYWIHNGTTLASISSAAAPPTGPTFPSGYTHWAYACSGRVNGSGNLLPIKLKGSRIFYNATQATAITAGTDTTETVIDISAIAPPNASRVLIEARLIGAFGVGVVSRDTLNLRHTTGSNYVSSLSSFASTGGDPRDNSALYELPNIGQQLYYLINRASTGGTAPSATVNVLGYSIPNGGD